MPDCEMRQECRMKFDLIEERLKEGDDSLRSHREQIHQTSIEMAKLQTHMDNLVNSMNNLTRGIWGMVMAIAGSGIAFVIWFIQSR